MNTKKTSARRPGLEHAPVVLTDYRIEAGTFSGAGGLTLRYKAWICEEVDSGRNLVFHHGFGEHCGRYEYLVEALAGDRVNLFSFDARGHGRSEGIRGGAGDITDMVRDLEHFMTFLREEFGVRCPLLLGHSMGGLVVLCFALHFSNQWETRGLLTSGAALKVKMNPVLRIKQVSGQIIGQFAPDLVLPAGVDPNLLSHDPREAQAYEDDPLVHGNISIRLGLDMVRQGKLAIENAARIKVPIFMGHGGGDEVADPLGTRQFFKGVQSEIAELRIYPGLYHEIFNESPDARSAVFDDYRRFIQNILAATETILPPVEPATES
ncbi:MAG TPA: alpha/beta hydrolase [Leptospiraceae bacterium]|jgi:lysophospholipase|nr:alpha/beta hydrolase [Leptospiraceae bacterium]HMX56866.1 alpha/beta hydrolase [Leptospiraceae bacterium]HMY46648.1 lysophospholipase [Leptospiraceae bacterium]HNJ34255.1 lysophospholipase [Leptospiraceae bacterium]